MISMEEWNKKTGNETFPWCRKNYNQFNSLYTMVQESDKPLPITLQTGKRAWLVANYDLAVKIFVDPRMSSVRNSDNYPYYFEPPESFKKDSGFLGWDGEMHKIYRSALSPEFSMKTIENYRELIISTANRAIDSMLQSPDKKGDLYEDYALQISSSVIGFILGVSQEHFSDFHHNSRKMISLNSSKEDRQNAISDLMNIIEGVVEENERSGSEDSLIGRVAKVLQKKGVYDHHEMVVLARLLMNAGHETSASMISFSSMILMNNKTMLDDFMTHTQQRRLAVQEFLRYMSVADLATSRFTLEEVVLNGVTIPKGEGIIILGGACNHDPQKFENPDEIQLDRKPNSHLAFGHGIHRCIGANLATLELELALPVVFERIPGIYMPCSPDEVPLKNGNVFFGPSHLPVCWK